MEVIKQGKKPTEKTYTGTCSNCRSQVRFRGSEATNVSHDRDGEVAHANCPVCGAVFWGYPETKPDPDRCSYCGQSAGSSDCQRSHA